MERFTDRELLLVGCKEEGPGGEGGGRGLKLACSHAHFLRRIFFRSAGFMKFCFGYGTCAIFT